MHMPAKGRNKEKNVLLKKKKSIKKVTKFLLKVIEWYVGSDIIYK